MIHNLKNAKSYTKIMNITKGISNKPKLEILKRNKSPDMFSNNRPVYLTKYENRSYI